jgi:DNA-binding response OmpR family regulator
MDRGIHRALIVDDDEPVREATARAMSAQSFWCETATDGAEALAKFRRSPHDLVVTDLRMPGMHGYALTLELLNSPQSPRIVVLTGLAEPSLVKDLYCRGVDDVVNKPVDVQEFATKMASLFHPQEWRDSLVASHHGRAPTSGHALIANVEHALDQRSTRMSPQIEELLNAAAASTFEAPQAMAAFLERTCQGGVGKERRQSERGSLLATVTAVPLTDSLEPCGEPFKAAARDASAGGISLLHTRAVTAQKLALRWPSLASPGRQISLVLQVKRSQPLGPFYEIAGEFAPLP